MAGTIRKKWFEMGEESTFSIDGENLFNAVLKIRRDFRLKLKTFREEKKKTDKRRVKCLLLKCKILPLMFWKKSPRGGKPFEERACQLKEP